MAKFDTIKTAIDANINTNGNQEITGSVMNSVLKQMVDSTDAELTELESNASRLAIWGREYTRVKIDTNALTFTIDSGNEMPIIHGNTVTAILANDRLTTSVYEIGNPSGYCAILFNTKNKTLRTTQVVGDDRIYIKENEVLLAIVRTTYGADETKSFMGVLYAGGSIVIDDVVYNDWYLDKKDIITLLSKNNLLYNKVSAIDGIVNVTFTATKAEHSSTLDQIPFNGKIGDVVKVKLSEGTAISDKSSTVVYFYKDGTDVQKQVITIDKEESITLKKDADYIGFYIWKITTLGTFIAGVKFVGELERLSAKSSNNSDIVEHTFNVTSTEHSSALDTMDVYCNKGDTIRVMISEVTGKCDGNNVSLSFFNSEGVSVKSVPVVINQETDIYINNDDIAKLGVYLYKVTNYGLFKLSVSKTDSIVKEYLAVKNLAKNSMFGETTLAKPLILLHFSDIHSNAKQLKNICSFQKKYNTIIKDSICTGDVVYENMDEEDNGLNRGFAHWQVCGAKTTMIAAGNHEYKKSDTGYSATTSKEVYDKFFAPYISNWKVVQPENADEDGLCYYYKDYSTEKVRLIVVDTNPVPNAANNRFTETQQNWLTSVLESARVNGFAVVIANHFCFKYPSVASRQTNNFDCLFGGGEDNSWSADESLADIVDIFIENGGKFVCHIAGHSHRDMFSVLESHNKQAIVNISCANNESNGLLSDMYREDDTESEKCFNLLKIDTSEGMFTLMRVGADKDIRLRNRRSLTWDYINGKLLHD